MADLERLTDEELVERSRRLADAASEACLEVLYRRYHQRVAYWCLRVCGDREQATDLAQDVFLRVHAKLHTFRAEARFSTWLYTVTRSVAVNRGQAAHRRRADSLEDDGVAEPVDPSPGADERAEREQAGARMRRAMAEALEPLEAQVLYLHFVDGLTLPGITELLGLTNKSGAKAYIVNGKRKLRRRLGAGADLRSIGAGGPS